MINGVAVENSDLLSREQILWCIEEAEKKAEEHERVKHA